MDCFFINENIFLMFQQQSSFDRAMYPDKTSHFEKMMMSMSSTTSISHPALKKSHPVPMSQSHMVPINAGITGKKLKRLFTMLTLQTSFSGFSKS